MSGSAPLQVELYGKLADPCGRTLTLAIPADGCPVAAVLELIAAHEPTLGAVLARTPLRVCVNDILVGQDALARPGDTLALMPPVSGG